MASTSRPSSCGSATGGTAASISPTWPNCRAICSIRSPRGDIRAAHPQKWAFLDTETTGLAGGAGTYAFLIGVGHATREGFRLRQFFMRDYGEEASLLDALAEYLAQFDVLITYNGKSFRSAAARDALCMARRGILSIACSIWTCCSARGGCGSCGWNSCRLVELENQILGVEREGDLPGEMIPYYYFDYLRTQQALRLVPIFHHNAIDILSLACLTAIVPQAFRLAGGARVPARRGPDRRWRAGCCGRSATKKRCASSAGPWIWGCRTICCFGRCGKRRSWRSGWGEWRRRWRGSRTWRDRAIRTACARSKRWPSITSTGSGIT